MNHVFPAIRNHQFSPPPGGWSVNLEIQGYTQNINGHTPFDVRAKAESFAESVGANLSRTEIEQILNAIWMERDPGRALLTILPVKTEVRHKEQSVRRSGAVTFFGPSQWGPSAWSWLHSFGMPGGFSKEEWSAAINRVSRLLNPSISNKTGCNECHQEWIAIQQDTPPSEVKSAEDAAKWTFDAHNRVNRKLNKRTLTFAQAAQIYGWNIP